MNKTNIDYGKKDILSKNEFNPENVKVRITTYIDLDILEALKLEAKKTRQKYQTLLNTKLRESISNEKTIYSSLNSIEERLGKVEHILRVD
jgi:uncharacterized protein (DUF4415 family)